ncbi:hypothetical protein PPL_08492 [Heterostelium album PN500]|uniref:Uncharacterized protein n=1 Tax=Heterostelium pallidum (strain ATCC 26659 / Pp 5 / PN500) TaxID=670386 RepID=D3BIC3_HETP5|nr:hypothetical protein PPL_08492 [Heterostelium album PN500]EFA79023.1 hypothetical protein PPL_08492 [Heterostelium album PN500]|eukprot:XP_020431146.1 hypothetical protein PPL_08492 [Heterostelium album PN500]
MNEIPPIVSSIFLNVDDSDLEPIYQLISRSNITKLDNCQSLRYILPESLTSLSFRYDFNEPLSIRYPPPHLKSLNLELTYFDKPIKEGDLPKTLERLKLGYSFNQPFEPGVLPPSLKILKYQGNHALRVGSLPPNLKKFKASVLWLPSIKSLSNLKSLSIFNGFQTIDTSYLPSSLTRLKIATGRLKSKIPSMKNICSIIATYDIDEIFKDRSQYQFEYLKVISSNQESLGLKMKHLEISIYGDKTENVRGLPDGIETLTIGTDYRDSLVIDDIPPSVRKLVIHSLDFFKKKEKIEEILPNSLQELVILHSGIISTKGNFDSDILPESLQSLTLPSIQLPQPRIPKNLVMIPSGENNLWLRTLDDHHYLFFTEHPNFISAIVDELQIPKIFALYKSFKMISK